MPAYEVSRTLVKSPPEVWSELEKVERLAELLGDDAITITRRDPETTIEWQGAAANGTIEIGASGWGTKVRLTAQVAAGNQSSAPVTAAPHSIAKPDLAAKPDHAAEIAPDLAAMVPASEPAESVAKHSLWQRFRGAFSSSKTDLEQELEIAVEETESTTAEGDASIDAVADAEIEAVAETKADVKSKADAKPETATQDQAEPVDFESVLTAVLDHLGSAHKRPFTAS